MKKQVLLCLIVATPILAKAQKALTYKDVVERDWYGRSVQESTLTVSGQIICAQGLHLVLNDDLSVSGTSTTAVTLDNLTYTRVAHVTGSLNTETNVLHLEQGYVINEDQLPGSLYWCSGSDDLQLYSDADRDGHYILKGSSHDSCSGDMEVEFVDDLPQ